MSLRLSKGGLAVELTVGRALGAAFVWGRVRYATSGFVTCSNRGWAGASTGGPLLQPFQLFAGGA